MRFDPSVVTVKQSSIVRQNLFYNYFGNLITGRLIEGGRYGGSLRARSRVLARLVSLAQIGELARGLLWWPLYGECLDLARRIGWEYIFYKTTSIDEWSERARRLKVLGVFGKVLQVRGLYLTVKFRTLELKR